MLQDSCNQQLGGLCAVAAANLPGAPPGGVQMHWVQQGVLYLPIEGRQGLIPLANRTTTLDPFWRSCWLPGLVIWSGLSSGHQRHSSCTLWTRRLYRNCVKVLNRRGQKCQCGLTGWEEMEPVHAGRCCTSHP